MQWFHWLDLGKMPSSGARGGVSTEQDKGKIDFKRKAKSLLQNKGEMDLGRSEASVHYREKHIASKSPSKPYMSNISS